jgi:hypothetical protein
MDRSASLLLLGYPKFISGVIYFSLGKAIFLPKDENI